MFFLIQSLHSLTANLKKAEKVEEFFSLKRVWEGGGGNSRKRDVTEDL